MQGERRTDSSALQKEYGISKRLATRLAALLSSRIDVTPTLIELASPGTALEKFLLRNEWFSESAELTENSLNEIADACGVADEAEIRVQKSPDGWLTVGIQDDVLADRAKTQTGEENQDNGEYGLIKAASGHAVMAESAKLFSLEEVAQLKLIALTSQDRNERIEAMRKLVFTPLAMGDKAAIFVNVLIDPLSEPAVRAEASRCLERLGFRADLADSIRSLLSADPAEAGFAIERIGSVLQTADKGDAAVTVAVIIELFDQSESPELQQHFLRIIERNAQLLAQNEFRMAQFVQSALKHLSQNFRPLLWPMEEALKAVADANPEKITELLWDELDRTDSGRIRSFLLVVINRIEAYKEKAGLLARRIIAEIMQQSLNEHDRARLRFALGRLGDEGVKAILVELPSADPIQKPELIRLLDVLCTEGKLSDEYFQMAASAMLDQLKVADRQTRRTVLETRVCADQRVGADLKKELAVEFLAHFHEFRLPDTRESIRLMLLSLGAESVDALFSFIRRHFPDEEANESLLTLGTVIARNGGDISEEVLSQISDFCIGAFERDDVSRGGFVAALAHVCGFTEMGGRKFDFVLNAMLQRLWKTPYSFDILDGLGIMVAAPNAQNLHQERLTDVFCEIVNMVPPESLGKRKDTPNGIVYEFGREIDFDTVVIPKVVRGLELICASPQASMIIRERIVKQLLILWEGVSNVRVVWSPGGIDALISAMSAAAQCRYVPVDFRARLGRSLLQFLNKLRVVKALGEICSQEDKSGGMSEFCIQAEQALMAAWWACEQQDGERKAALLGSMAKIAANTTLDAQSEDVIALRDEVVHALFQGLRENMTGIVDSLCLVRDCPAYPEKVRDEIRARINKAFGLVRDRD